MSKNHPFSSYFGIHFLQCSLLNVLKPPYNYTTKPRPLRRADAAGRRLPADAGAEGLRPPGGGEHLPHVAQGGWQELTNGQRKGLEDISLNIMK